MSLPNIGDRSIMRPSVQRGFGGLNHNKSAGDGEIYWMQNMSSREYPLLTQRGHRGDAGFINCLGSTGEVLFGAAWEGVSENNPGFMYQSGNNYYKGYLPGGKKQFAVMNGMVFIFPDKRYYDIAADSLRPMGITYTLSTDSSHSRSLWFMNGTYAGVEAKANTLYRAENWTFSPGDAVTISGCVIHPENNKTAIVREVEPGFLRFDENTFTLDSTLQYTAGAEGLPAGTYHFENGQFTLSAALSEGDTLTWNGTGLDAVIGGVSSTVTVTEGSAGEALVFADIPTNYGETATITVSRSIPDLDFICVNENRLWGCKGDTIYASALGDPFNFNVFEGLATDSWQSSTQGVGDFTACVSYGGYPIFFKEDTIIKVQGDKPSNFQWTMSSRFGVKAGCEKSLAVAGETLFYLSPAGICAYNGGSPRIISDALGVNKQWWDAAAGSDGILYYVSMCDQAPPGEGDADRRRFDLFVYDTRYGVWTREDDLKVTSFAYVRDFYHKAGALYGSVESGVTAGYCIVLLRPYDPTQGWDNPISWSVEFADMVRYYETTDSMSQNKKGLLRLQLRCELAQGATIKAYVMYDSDGVWHEIGTVTGETGGSPKRSYNLPMILRRCDHFRLKLTGTGESVIYSLTEVRYAGSQLQGGSVQIGPGQ